MSMRLFFALALGLAGVSQARAQEAVSNFYRGRQLTVIIPSSVGGGYDLYGRLVARHIGKHLPGNPNVVASNMAGAAGVVAAQYVYAAGAKDGPISGRGVCDMVRNRQAAGAWHVLRYDRRGARDEAPHMMR